jgi:hypothetical protein
LARRDYIAERDVSDFRRDLWRVIATLNPNQNKLLFESFNTELNIQDEHYPLLLEDFKKVAAVQAVRANNAMNLVNTAITILENVKPLRAKEASSRWRAGFDLAHAQLHIFRLRLFQFLLTVDQHANNMPMPAKEDSNEWNFWRNRQQIVPNEDQFKRLKTFFKLTMERDEYLAMVAAEETKSLELLETVKKEHPGTPWARRAEREQQEGFGFRVGDRLWDPKDVRRTIKLPNL